MVAFSGYFIIIIFLFQFTLFILSGLLEFNIQATCMSLYYGKVKRSKSPNHNYELVSHLNMSIPKYLIHGHRPLTEVRSGTQKK